VIQIKKGIGEDLIELLDPFLELTNILSCASYGTCSVVLPGVQYIIDWLHNYESRNINHFMRELAVDMAKDLYDRSRPFFKNQLFIAASFLDPRYKKFKFIKSQFERDFLHSMAKQYIRSIHHK
jgi:hypothetical protein